MFGHLFHRLRPHKEPERDSQEINLNTLGRFHTSAAGIETDVRKLRIVGALDFGTTDLAHEVSPLYCLPTHPHTLIAGTAPVKSEAVKLQGVLTKKEVRKGAVSKGTVVMLSEAYTGTPQTVLWADKSGVHYDPASIALPKIQGVHDQLEETLYGHLLRGELKQARSSAWRFKGTVSKRKVFALAVLGALDQYEHRYDNYDGTVYEAVNRMMNARELEMGPSWNTLSTSERRALKADVERIFCDQVEYLSALIPPGSK